MKLQTPVQIPSPPWKMHLADRCLCMGSCFAENLAEHLIHHRLDTTVNPFGITFNPLSLGQQLHQLLAEKAPAIQELFAYDDIYHHWDYHGRFSSPNSTDTIEGMLASFSSGTATLATADQLILTWGSAHYYFHLQDQTIVNNCHKVPGSAFERRRATIDQIVDLWEPLLLKLTGANPGLHITLSVSPVRYVRDGLVESNRSKSTLILAAEALTQRFPDQVYYFPSYEIQIDELRDYRFFAPDMVHPTEQAIEFILHRYLETLLSPEELTTWTKLQQLVRQLDHRPLHPDAPRHQKSIVEKEAELTELLLEIRKPNG